MTMTLYDYFKKASGRLPEEAHRVLNTLLNAGKMNKEDLSLMSTTKRAVLDHVLFQLYALGLVDISSEGKSKMCEITKLGEQYLDIVADTDEAM
ncbi:transcriptional regulator [Desulfofalx alkaliphila]|uniref:transcriptional regulator n=1 Tax=Desulfofalx alkaliphila TaxID=105483 RepID=UPI0004E1CE90